MTDKLALPSITSDQLAEMIGPLVARRVTIDIDPDGRWTVEVTLGNAERQEIIRCPGSIESIKGLRLMDMPDGEETPQP